MGRGGGPEAGACWLLLQEGTSSPAKHRHRGDQSDARHRPEDQRRDSGALVQRPAAPGTGPPAEPAESIHGQRRRRLNEFQ